MATKAKSKSKSASKSINPTAVRQLRDLPLRTPSDLSREATRDISAALNGLLADVFALYLKTKNFHWHVSGPHFRDYHLMLDEQGDQLAPGPGEIQGREPRGDPEGPRLQQPEGIGGRLNGRHRHLASAAGR